MSQKIRLEWRVTNRHVVELTSEDLADLLRMHRIDADPADLEGVYNALDDGGWKAYGLLQDLASDRNWVDTDNPELVDVDEVSR